MKVILFVFLAISTLSFSQKVSIVYETKYQLNVEKPEHITKGNMILDIDKNISIFRESWEKESDSLRMNNGNAMYRMGVENQFYVKKDLTQHKIEKIITYLGTDYLLPIDEKLKWKITAEQKTIGEFKSQKAETSYGGRNWTAWFTTELPISDGPYIFHGLPGLIIALHDDKNEYSFNLIQVKKGGYIFDVRKKNLKIDWKEYEILAKSHFNDPYDLKSKAASTLIIRDHLGNKMDITKMSQKAQDNILKENNPLELNHRIIYK